MGLLYFSKVPAKYDSQEPKLDLELTRLFNVNINVDASEALDAFAHVPPARRAALGKAFEPVSTLSFERSVRSVAVGNELYPTASRAQLLGVSKDQLADSFWGGVNVDYQKLQATAQAGIAVLAAGKEVHLHQPQRNRSPDADRGPQGARERRRHLRRGPEAGRRRLLGLPPAARCT